MCRANQIRWSLFLLLLGPGSAASQTPVWTQFPNSPGGTTRNDDIHFVDPLNGWSARGRDGIYGTTNGGATWTKVNSNLNPVAHFRCIGFASASRGWAGNLGTGSYDTFVTDTNVLYETWDGGLTWSNHPGFAEAGMKGLCAIQVFDEQTIYGAGRVRGPAFFIKSTDGGTNWFMTNLTTAGVMGALMDVYFHDQTNGFIVGMNTNLYASSCPSPYTGQIARTTNGGASWFVVATAAVPCSYFWKMSWPTPQVGYVSLQKNPTAADAIVYYKTSDGGATWSSNGIPVASFGNTQFYWQGVGFVNPNEGWAGGEGSSSPYFNSFLHTTNGGVTWEPAGYNNTRSINRIRFLTPTLGFAAGQQLHIFRIPLAITADPTNQTVVAGGDAQFHIAAQGTAPLAYQWRFHGTNLAAAGTSTYTITNVQATNAGDYDVVVSDYSGSLTSAVASLTVTPPAGPFQDDFDGYSSPSIVTNPGTTNGYKIFFGAASGAADFKAVFGFDYSAVTFPTSIPPAPHSVGGTTKGLYLTVNKDAFATNAAVNLYPTGQVFTGNFVLKFDLWINWSNPDTSTEHTLFGINHSGDVTNRIGQTPSDGLFFAMAGEDDSLPTSMTLRDYSVFRGGGSGAPILMTTNNTTFGPAPLLAPQFENYNPGFVALLPSQTIPGYGPTPAGTAGLRWVGGEVRQTNKRISWLLNDTLIAQYTNMYAYTNGNILIGYNDHFSSIGDSNNFAIFDNIRVATILPSPVTILSPHIAGNNFGFSFATELYETYTVQWATNLASPINWVNYTNLLGDGTTNSVLVPLLNQTQQYFRVSRP